MKEKMGWACSTYGGREELYTEFWWGDLRERDRFIKWDGEAGVNWCGSGWGQVAGACECGNEHSGSTKCGEFLD